MVRVALELFRHDLEQFLLHLIDVLPRRDAGAVADPEDVRVHRDGGVAEGRIENHVGRFAPHAGQRLQGFAIFGDPAAVLG